MISHEDFLEEINTFLNTSGMAETTFGTEALGDPNFIRNIKEGREPRRATRVKVIEWIRKRPAEAAA